MAKNIRFESRAFEQFRYWAEHDRKLQIKIFELINDTSRNPFTGLGKPEPLKGSLKGFWSRRINDEHRLIYSVTNSEIIIVSCKGHYEV